MSPERRLLLVVVCAFGLVVVAATFPAADPRLDAPGSESSVEASGNWSSVTETPERTNEQDTEERSEPGEDDATLELRPKVDGDLVPGTTARVGVAEEDLRTSEYRGVTMLVDGEDVGVAGGDEMALFEVPTGTESVTVAVEETGDSVEVPVETDISITVKDYLVPGAEIEIRGTIGEYRVGDATVLVDGETVGTTSGDGTATVPLPETAGEAEILVERDELAGTYTADVAEPDIAFTSRVIFPGMPAHVSVNADTAPVENATVALGDGSETTTSGSGGTWVRVPLTDEVTATTTVGDEQASTTVSNLYLRTTVIVLVVPGLLIGAAWTYLRYAPHRYRRHTDFSEAMLNLAALLGGASTALTNGITASLNTIRSVRFPRFRFPTLSLSVPSMALLTGNTPSLRMPSLGGLVDSLTWSGTSGESSLSNTVADVLSRTREADDETRSTDSASESAETATADSGSDPVPDSTQELRDAWHTFLDHVGIRNRETWTPGEASRYALAAGYPGKTVRRLLARFRSVEYGDAEPSSEDVADARSAVETLIQHDPEDDSK